MSEKDIKLLSLEENRFTKSELDGCAYDTHEDDSFVQILEDIELLLANIEEQIDEGQLWRIVAGVYSDEWLEARSQLDLAEDELSRIIEDPDRMPLGSIGQALDAHEIRPLEENLSLSFGNFISIDQELRDDVILSGILEELKGRNALFVKSDEENDYIQTTSEVLDELFAEEPTSSTIANTNSIVDTFKSYADKLLSINNTIEDIEVNPSANATEPAL